MAVNNPRHSRFFWRSSAMFCILDEQRAFKEVNTAWEQILGLSTGQLLAKSFLDFVHLEDQPSTEYYIDQLGKGLPSVSFSARVQHRDGSYRNVLWLINSAASIEYAYYVVGMDITGREQPMIADEMISVLNEGVVLQYANGTIGACNPSAERILGLSSDQMMGWTLIDPDWRAIHEDGSPFPTETHPAICTLRTGQAYSDVVMGVVKSDESVIWIRINAYPLWRDDVTTPYAVVISFSDITHYKATEAELRKASEQRSSGMIPEQSYDLWDWDVESNEANFSPRWKKMLGFEPQELPNTIDAWHQRIHPADYKRVMADIQNLLTGNSEMCEDTHRVQHRDGTYRWILSRAVLVRDVSNKPHHVVGTHVDITEPRRIEDELQEIEKKYLQLMELESDGVFLIDADNYQILEHNKAAVRMYEYSRNQLAKMKLLDLSAQPDKTANVLKRASKQVSQQYHRRQDETVFPVEVSLGSFVLKGKNVLMITVRDTSERQQIETALWENESKYRQLFEAASNPTIVFDANTQQIFDVNHGATDLYGYTKEEFMQMTTMDVSAETSRNRAAFTSSNKKVQTIPLRWHKKKDGSIFPVEISTGNTYLFQGRSLICATLRDITERKAAEEALRKERDFINTLVQASPAFFFAVNPDGRVRMANRAMLSALEYEMNEVVDQDFLSIFVPENERIAVATEFEVLSKSMQPSMMESHVLSKSGKPLLVEWHSRAIVKADGTLDYFFGVGIDVTERKKAQGHLRLFKSIIESSSEAIAIANPDGQLVYVNPAYERLINFSLKDSRHIHFQDYFTEASSEIWKNDILPALDRGESWEGELEMHDSEGAIFPVWKRMDSVRDNKGNILFNFALLHDISERKRMWETLRKQWEEHQTIFNNVPAMIWYRDKDNKLVRNNRVAADVFGPDNSFVQHITDCDAVIQLGRAEYGTLQTYRNKSGDERWLQLDKIPYRDAQGHIAGVIIFAFDITEYKQAEVSLKDSEEQMYQVVENMPFLFNAFDDSAQILVWNRSCEEISGYSADEIIGNPRALELLYPDDEERYLMINQWRKVDAEKNHWETHLTCKSGAVRTVVWYSISKRYPIDGWEYWLIGQDVTEQYQLQLHSRSNEQLLAAVLETSKLGLSLSDDRGRFLQVNRAFADMYGYRIDELVGEPFTTILPSALHGEAVREYYSLLMTHESPTVVRQRQEQHRTGQLFEAQSLVSRVILEDRRRLLVTVMSKLAEPALSRRTSNN
ncbi:PAS domain S-box protein [Thioflexithrix psekupsensis]|uniref:histidine kinase n=1 Tax=Thioflexithrix psekupsensis TaxID=1570016 RepID=A0A251XC86_9GAMM|nr:PAS domain S-box protein [Thioflexithrix psekupsensis]OUD15515.1 hypothetical protein TPSD3_03055 [Thioflexithrix psekupsensis]